MPISHMFKGILMILDAKDESEEWLVSADEEGIEKEDDGDGDCVERGFDEIEGDGCYNAE
jgi:hypothetical protein